jgi:molybdenum storage protein
MTKLAGATSAEPVVAKDVPSLLMRQTLLDRELVRPVDRPVIRVLPWLRVVAIGGTTIMDRGRDAVIPLVGELRAALAEHRMLILTADGVSYLPHGTVANQLATHLSASRAVVANSYPPYGVHEFPPPVGKISPHRSDAGAFLLADAYGAAQLVYVKDVDGVHDGPSGGTNGFGTRIGVGELLGRSSAGLPVDPLVLELMTRAKHVREIQIVDGLVPGNLTLALAGKNVGTVIHAD